MTFVRKRDAPGKTRHGIGPGRGLFSSCPLRGYLTILGQRSTGASEVLTWKALNRVDHWVDLGRKGQPRSTGADDSTLPNPRSRARSSSSPRPARSARFVVERDMPFGRVDRGYGLPGRSIKESCDTLELPLRCGVVSGLTMEEHPPPPRPLVFESRASTTTSNRNQNCRSVFACPPVSCRSRCAHNGRDSPSLGNRSRSRCRRGVTDGFIDPHQEGPLGSDIGTRSACSLETSPLRGTDHGNPPLHHKALSLTILNLPDNATSPIFVLFARDASLTCLP